MRSSNRLILGLLLLIIIAVASSAVYMGLGTNNINIVINTNGTNTDIDYQTILYGSIPQEMIQEIKDKATIDVESSNSTVDSIKSDVKNIASKFNYNANVSDFVSIRYRSVANACNCKWNFNASYTTGRAGNNRTQNE